MSQKKRKGLCFVMAGLMLGSVVTGCKTSTDKYSSTVVATYGDENIYMDEAYFYAKLTQYQYETYYGSSLWSYDFTGSGKTFEDSVKENVMSQIYQTYVLNDEAEEMGISLNEDQIAVVLENVEEFMSNEKLVEATKATEAMVEKVYTMNAIANLVYESLVEDTDREVDEDEFRCKKISYIALTTESKDVTEEGLEAVAEEVLEAMKEGTDFEEIEKSYEADNIYKLAVTEDSTLMEDDNTMYQEAAWALSTGEFTKTFSEKTGYWYVIQCTDDDDEEAKAKAIASELETREEETFEEKYATILKTAKSFEVKESKWEEIQFVNDPAYVAESTEDTTTAEETTGTGTTEAEQSTEESVSSSEETSTEE